MTYLNLRWAIFFKITFFISFEWAEKHMKYESEYDVVSRVSFWEGDVERLKRESE